MNNFATSIAFCCGNEGGEEHQLLFGKLYPHGVIYFNAFYIYFNAFYAFCLNHQSHHIIAVHGFTS